MHKERLKQTAFTDARDEQLLVKREETQGIGNGYVRLKEGARTPENTHPDEEEIYLILKGEGLVRIGDEEERVSGGDVLYVPAKTRHEVICDSSAGLEYLYFAHWF